MKQTVLRPLRIIISVIIIFLTSLLFIDIKEIIPVKFFDYILFTQFFPSFLKFTHALSWISAGFIFIIILSFLFGRIYCSFLCPLGILQDFISFISGKLKIIKRFKYSKPLNILRYSILTAAFLLMVFDITILFTMLEPYSNYGRIMNGLFRPLVIAVNNMVAFVMESIGIYSVSPVHIKTNLMSVSYPVIILGVIIWFAGKRGRLYCNSLCPVGTLLGLFSKASVFKLKINGYQCTSCGKCAFVCKAECINIKEKAVDMSRCIGCMNCINSCEIKVIKYRLAIQPAKKEVVPDKRNFVKKTITGALFLIGISKSIRLKASGYSYGHNKRSSVKINKKFAVSPPGSESHEHFNHDCTGCHLCVSACPTKVLQPSGLEYGLKGFLQPYMDYTTSYCNYDCTRCGDVCPTGAILPVSKEEKKTIQIGKVSFVIDNCVVYIENTHCGACAELCPTAAVHMVPYKNGLTIPETDTSVCIGCGACEYACPMTPYKAIYVDGNEVHTRAKRPNEEAIDEEVIDDFPF